MLGGYINIGPIWFSSADTNGGIFDEVTWNPCIQKMWNPRGWLVESEKINHVLHPLGIHIKFKLCVGQVRADPADTNGGIFVEVTWNPRNQEMWNPRGWLVESEKINHVVHPLGIHIKFS